MLVQLARPAEHADPDIAVHGGRAGLRRAGVHLPDRLHLVHRADGEHRQGGILAAFELPLAPGAMWAEFPPQGAEWGVPALGNTAANTGVHLFVTASVATSARSTAST